MSITIQFAQRGESYLGKFHQIEKNRLQLDYRFFSPGHRFELLYLVQQVMLSFTYNPGGFPGFFHGWTGSAESSGENNCRNSLKRAPLGRFSRLFGQPPSLRFISASRDLSTGNTTAQLFRPPIWPI